MRPELADLRPESADLPPEPVEGELLADHTTLRVGGPARRMITVETEAELVEAVRELDAPTNQCWCSVEGQTCWSATPASTAPCSRSRRAASRGHGGMLRCGDHRCRRRTMGPPGAIRRRAWLERPRGDVRHSRLGRRDTDPKRWRLWGRGQRADLHGAYARPVHRATQDLVSDRMRLRLPNVAFQVRSGTLRGAVGDLPAPPGLDVATDPIPRAGPRPGCGSRASVLPAADVREAVLELRAAKGMVLVAMIMTPGASARSSPTPSSVRPRPARYPQTRRASANPMAWSRPVPPGSSNRPGFAKGYGHGAARISGKHTLALTNRGGATAAELASVSRERSGPA